MNSSYINDFVKIFGLRKEYNIFMKNYAKNINNYILYFPLSKGIKAYISNYFRIILNIHSIELIGEFNNEEKKNIIISYLLIQLLHESFHFLSRLSKIGYTTKNAVSPAKLKLKQIYQEIGVDLILYLFGTEYIKYISKQNSILISNINSWKNNNTNFKVFNKVYVKDFELYDEEDKEKNFDSGLKCNITEGYGFFYDVRDLKICTNDTIRYCY